jgi:hypothetical protein
MDTDAYFLMMTSVITVINTFLIFDVWHRYTDTTKLVLGWMVDQELTNQSLVDHIQVCLNCSARVEQ